MSFVTKGSCSSSGGRSSKNGAFPTAFSRLSAGSAIRAGPEPPGWCSAPGNYLESFSRSDGWQARSLKSLEAAVAALHASTEAVEKVRRAFEAVSRENATAAQAQAGQVDAFLETSGSWYWCRGGSQYSRGLRDGTAGVASTHRLLG